MRARATAAAGALLAALAGGCAGAGVEPAGPAAVPASGAASAPVPEAPGPDRRGPAAPTVHDRWGSGGKAAPVSADGQWATSQEALTLPLLGDGFRPGAAVVCRVDLRERPGGGTGIVAEEARADDPAAV